MTEDLLTGQHRNPGREPEIFTTAYFHDRDSITGEITDSGLHLHGMLPVEGPLHWAPGVRDRLATQATAAHPRHTRRRGTRPGR